MLISAIFIVPNKKAPKPMARNITPPVKQRFSTFVESAKYPIEMGIPKPNDAPKRKKTIRRLFLTMVSISIGINEDTVPKINHTSKNGILLHTALINVAPDKAKIAAARKLVIKNMRIS
ncbi:MAG: hypothetical protein QXJ11_03440 [Candidatus Bathyarchaeia archaeon]